MIIVEFADIELDTCVSCRGLWFDAQELGQLFELAGVPERICELELQIDRLSHAGSRRKCPLVVAGWSRFGRHRLSVT